MVLDPGKRAASKRAYEERNREARLAAAAEWKAANREQVRAAARAYAAAHPDERRAWREANVDRIAERRRVRYEESPDRERQQMRDWRRANPAKVTRHRAYKHGLTPALLLELFEAQGRRCAICRSPRPLDGPGGLVIDHDHGTGRRRGLLCQACNVALPAIEAHGADWGVDASAYLVRPPLSVLRAAVRIPRISGVDEERSA